MFNSAYSSPNNLSEIIHAYKAFNFKVKYTNNWIEFIRLLRILNDGTVITCFEKNMTSVLAQLTMVLLFQ